MSRITKILFPEFIKGQRNLKSPCERDFLVDTEACFELSGSYFNLINSFPGMIWYSFPGVRA